MGAPRAVNRLGRLRGLSGTAAAGLAVWAVALAVAAVVASRSGAPGPGTSTLLWHGGGAVVALAGQVYADRTPGGRGVLAAVLVLALVAAVLGVQWLV